MTPWTTFHLRVDTPLFSGDHPGTNSGDILRVPSVLGVLRFWYRAIAAGHGITDLNALAASETSVFGSTTSPSRLRLRIPPLPEDAVVPAGQRPPWSTYSADKFAGPRYLLGQGLWDHKQGLLRPHLPVDTIAELKVRFPDDRQTVERFMLAMWAWLTYGGLGARTRRGFGRLSCHRITDAPFDTQQWRTLLSPDDSVRENLERWWNVIPDDVLAATTTAFPDATADPRDDIPATELAPFPILSGSHWEANSLDDLNQPSDQVERPLAETLHHLGREWRGFRTDDAGKHTPEWQHTVNGTSSKYPIAALGLPVGYHRISPALDATVNLDVNDTEARRASPVWLTPLRLDRPGGARYAAFTHVFFAKLHPVGANATLKRSDRPTARTLTLPNDDTTRAAWRAWLNGQPRCPPNFDWA